MRRVVPGLTRRRGEERIVGQIVQVGGSLLILVPFVLAQFGRMSTGSLSYIALNLVGSSVLAVDAALGRQWGFLLLEGVWALVSLFSLIRVVRGARADSAAHGPPPGGSTGPSRG
jgi:hypothetical protein